MVDINIVDGRLGGVGKSLFSCCLIHIHDKFNLPYLAIDADPQTYNVHHFYPQTQRLAFSKSDLERMDVAWESATEEANNIIVNLAASSSDVVYEWLMDNRLLEAAAQSQTTSETNSGGLKSIRFINWFLCDASPFSVEQFLESVATYGDRMIHVLVKNEGRGKDVAWERLAADTDSELNKTLELPYVISMVLPLFRKPLSFESNQQTFAQAIDATQTSFKYLDCNRIKTFTETVEHNVIGLGLLQKSDGSVLVLDNAVASPTTIGNLTRAKGGKGFARDRDNSKSTDVASAS